MRHHVVGSEKITFRFTQTHSHNRYTRRRFFRTKSHVMMKRNGIKYNTRSRGNNCVLFNWSTSTPQYFGTSFYSCIKMSLTSEGHLFVCVFVCVSICSEQSGGFVLKHRIHGMNRLRGIAVADTELLRLFARLGFPIEISGATSKAIEWRCSRKLLLLIKVSSRELLPSLSIRPELRRLEGADLAPVSWRHWDRLSGISSVSSGEKGALVSSK